MGRVRYVVCMDEQGTVRAFHNVCRHHAAAVATGSGCVSSFVCPYHVISSFPCTPFLRCYDLCFILQLLEGRPELRGVDFCNRSSVT